jgi:hypothetical protein
VDNTHNNYVRTEGDNREKVRLYHRICATVYAGGKLVWFGSMVFEATSNNISVISWMQFYWWGKPEFPKKPPNCKFLTNLIT